MKEKLIMNINKVMCLLVFTLCILLFASEPYQALADDDASAVTVVGIDYETFDMLINPQGNTKVYYSASGKNTWYEIEGTKNANGLLVLDISWIAVKSEYAMDLKGSDDETIVKVTLPASNTSLKVKYNAADSELIFENEDGAVYFEWKKSTSYEWNTNCLIVAQGGDEFLEAIEELKVKGGKIIVRLPQDRGTSENNTGARPSKEVTVTIPKRANAPSLKVNVTNLTLNTTTAMEYKVHSVGGVLKSDEWDSCEKSMELSNIASEALASNIKGSDVVIAIRKATTSKTGYSKTCYITIPGQAVSPTEIIVSNSATKYVISFPKASQENPYQYAVVKAGNTVDEARLSWKSVTSSKAINYTNKSLPAGSTIYVRLKGIAFTTKTSLRLPSAFKKLTVSYTE